MCQLFVCEEEDFLCCIVFTRQQMRLKLPLSETIILYYLLTDVTLFPLSKVIVLLGLR